MKKTIFTLIKYILTFIAVMLGLNILMLLSSLIPSSLLEQHVKESANIIVDQKEYWAVTSIDGIDNCTDALMLNEAYSIDNTDPIYSYMSARKNFKKGLTTKEQGDFTGELHSINVGIAADYGDGYAPGIELLNFTENRIDTSFTYTRYWHGYLIYLRPLLLFINITGIRVVQGLFLGFLFLYLIYLLYKKFDKKIASIFAFSILAVKTFFIVLSMQGFPVYAIALLASIILLKNYDKIKDFGLFFFVIGIVTNFFDYLTVPLLTLGIPLIIYLLLKIKDNKKYTEKQVALETIKYIIIWFLGYAITWFSKFAIYSIAYDSNALVNGIQQMFYRSERSNYKSYFTIQGTIREFLLTTYLFSLIVYFVIKFVYKFIHIFLLNYSYKKDDSYKKYQILVIPFVIIGILPFVWYSVLANHTILHYYFVYRHTLLTILTSLLLILFCVNKKAVKNK